MLQSLWGGLDIGSTTVKMVVVDEQLNIIFLPVYASWCRD